MHCAAVLPGRQMKRADDAQSPPARRRASRPRRLVVAADDASARQALIFAHEMMPAAMPFSPRTLFRPSLSSLATPAEYHRRVLAMPEYIYAHIHDSPQMYDDFVMPGLLANTMHAPTHIFPHRHYFSQAIICAYASRVITIRPMPPMPARPRRRRHFSDGQCF